jgi:hypothetical protein
MGGFGAGKGDLAAGRSGPIEALSFGGLRPTSIVGQVAGGRCPLDGTEQGRGEKREGGREKRTGIQIKFS